MANSTHTRATHPRLERIGTPYFLGGSLASSMLGDAPFDRAQLGARRLSPALEGSGRSVFVSSPEDLILCKLDWYRQGGGVSDRQWRDVLGVLEVQAERLDLAHLRHWAAPLELAELLERALSESGILGR
jgi:hypothetical protein